MLLPWQLLTNHVTRKVANTPLLRLLNHHHHRPNLHGYWMSPCCRGNSRSLSRDAATQNSLSVHVTEFDTDGNYHSKVARKSEVLFRHEIQPRDIRFSTFSSLVVRANSIILRLKHIKAIINSDSLVLLDSNHHSIKEFLPELKASLTKLFSLF
jgi:hypothetical protein